MVALKKKRVAQPKKTAAKKTVKEYAESKKNVFKEILKVTHKKPKTVRDDGLISFGGTDEAWYYWQRQGKFWETTPGVQDFLKECLKEQAAKEAK